ncbi:MAG: glycosyltransferase family 4 protein [Gemmatimonadaceae bacterium]|nr:glycosyltransferase family 4 protein [Gemmatimonadaceae bacterium]
MRIGVDATCWANARGYGRFARELMRALVEHAPDDRFICIGDQTSLDAFPLEAPNVERHVVTLSATPSVAAAADGHRTLADMFALTRAVYRRRPDVFFSPSVYTWFPLAPGQRAVVTVHDAIAERFPHLTLPSRRARLFWKLKVGLAIRQARLVLTVSDYAAGEIERMLGVPRRRLRVAVEAPAAVYEPSAPADIESARRAWSLGQAPYFVYVGGFNPHKRLDAVIRAHGDVAREAGRVAPHLLLVGRLSGDVFHGEADRLRTMIAEEGTGHLVQWTGFVPDEDLRHLHSGATAVVLASESEGFGLPAVEGAACGTPVIATRESPLPALLARGGIFVAPGNAEEIAAAMRALLDDPARRREMGAVAFTQARALTWQASAAATHRALREAAA